jgi:WD repeat-containing protein 35
MNTSRLWRYVSRDLACQLRRKLGDWFRIVQIIQSGAIASDVMQNEAWNELGDFYYDRQQWLVMRVCVCV